MNRIVKFLSSAIASCLIVAGLSSCASASEPTRILILGDSITQGKSGDYTWRYFYWKALKSAGNSVDFVGPNTKLHTEDAKWTGDNNYADPNFDQDHEAMWGRTSYDAKQEWDQRFIWWFDLDKDMDTYNPDIIVNMLGHNDIWLMNGGTDTESTNFLIANQRFIIEKARAKNPDVDFAIVKMGATYQFGSKIAAYNAALVSLRDELSTSKSKIVLIESGLTDIKYTYDGAHPNETGERRIAERVRVAVESLGLKGAPVPQQTSTKPAQVNLVTPKATKKVGKKSATVSWTRQKGVQYKVWVKRGGRWHVRTNKTNKTTVPLSQQKKSVRIQAVAGGRVSGKSNTITIPKKRK